MVFQVINFNTDTIVVNVKGKLPEGLEAQLEEWKREAQDLEEDVQSSYLFNGSPMFIKPHGSKGQWRWILIAGDSALHLDIGKGKLNGIICKMRLSSFLLHERGPIEAILLIMGFAEELFGPQITFQTSEVHLCADIVGWEPTLSDTMSFVTRSRAKVVRLSEQKESEDGGMEIATPIMRIVGRKVNEFKFSQTAPHSCDIYDKTLECRTHHKEWFHEVWKKNGWDGEARVFRVEFRYERECLREMGIEDSWDMLDVIPAMWAYSTKCWLRHTCPANDTNQGRWEESEFWQAVQGASGYPDATPAVRPKKVDLDAERAKAGFVGYATSWAIREVWKYAATQEQGMPAHSLGDVEGDDFLAWSWDPVQEYLEKRKQMTFGELMQAKADRMTKLIAQSVWYQQHQSNRNA